MSIADVSRWLLIAVPGVLIPWDLFAFVRGGRQATLSHQMWAWSLRYRWFATIIAAAAAVLTWHFFWEP